LIRTGYGDLKGLCLALSDWFAELRLIQMEAALTMRKPAAVGTGRAESAVEKS